jgi:hypothetical protein
VSCCPLNWWNTASQWLENVLDSEQRRVAFLAKYIEE